MDSQTLANAKKIVFRYLKYRPRSEQEIIDKLRSKDFSDELVKQTVNYFKKIGALNDAQFALGWTRSRLNKPYGVRRIQIELKHKGINKDLITSAVDEATRHYDEHDVIMELAKRRMRKYNNLDKITARRRIFGYLARRGFNSGVIVKAIKELEK